MAAPVGLRALGACADGLGLADLLSARVRIAGERLPVHDRGKVLVQALFMLAGGGNSCADIEELRATRDPFGFGNGKVTHVEVVTNDRPGNYDDNTGATSVAVVRTKA